MIEGIPPVIQAAVFTLLMAILRILSDGVEKRFWRMFIEAVYCTGLGVTAYFIIVVLEMRIEWTIVLAGLIGSLGSLYTRAFTHTMVMRRLQIQDIERQGFTHHTTGKEDEEIRAKDP